MDSIAVAVYSLTMFKKIPIIRLSTYLVLIASSVNPTETLGGIKLTDGFPWSYTKSKLYKLKGSNFLSGPICQLTFEN